jgi:biopolymer transport protein ExbB
MFVQFDWMGALTESPIMIVLVGCSVLTLGYAVERAIYFRRRSASPDATHALAKAALGDGRYEEAVTLCANHAHPWGTVAAATLAAHRRNPAESEETMHVALSQEKMLLERNTGMLGTMAAIAPLLGLLGTVWGIMRAFQAMASSGSAAPSVVAAGVAEALVTTAAGLVIAVPAVMLYNHFNRRLAVMLTVAENGARSLRVTANSAPPAARRAADVQADADAAASMIDAIAAVEVTGQATADAVAG